MIKKIIRLLPIFALTASAAYAHTGDSKTFLLPRPQGVNLAMELSTWHDHIFTHAINKKNSHIQTTLFAQGAVRGEETGRYFGIGNGKNSFHIGTPPTVWQDIPYGTNTDVGNIYLVHKDNYNFGDPDTFSTLAGTVALNPKQETYGLRLDWYQFLNHPFKKLFFKVSLPFVYVENDIHFRVQNSVPDSVNNTIHAFFSGEKITPYDADSAQTPLKHLKFAGRKTALGLADADICLGYRLVEKEKKHCNLYIALTAPTGNRAKSEYLFEPIYGNGRHVALGWGIDASAQLWKKERHSGRIIFALNQRYLFDGTEKRTIPLKESYYPFSHYYLAGKVGQENKPLFPAANVLTQDVGVRPGNQIDSILALAFKSKRFLVDLGYNLFYKEAEAVKFKHHWTDDKYAVATADYEEIDTELTGDYILFPLNKSNLNINGAATPSQVTHKAFGSLGYKFMLDNKYPTSLSAGASYEFAESNHALEGYAFWGKFIISF
jgi:hypothetical protein